AEEALAPYASLAGALIAGDEGVLDLAPGGPLGRRLIRAMDGRVVPREVFDAALVEAATRSGAASLQLHARDVGPWDREAGGRQVRGHGPDGPVAFLAGAVVLAGGYGCRIAADLNPDAATAGAEPPRGIARRGYFDGVTSPADRIVFTLDDWVLPGYGWVFPLPGGRANVGVGTLVGRDDDGGEHLRDLYDRFVHDPASPVAHWLAGATPAGRARTWPLDLGPRRRRLAGPGAVVAGEAAGFVGPLTGAGIAFALDSGEAAGRAVVAARGSGSDDPLHWYARETSRAILPWLRTEGLVQRWLAGPGHLGALTRAVRPWPVTGTAGAALLLNLG
ncbi:MAG: hypothetical protein H0U40_12090, partial [Chloroflexia bacterium]|nr:hypothetical protein [Chloroflexia bacterium]